MRAARMNRRPRQRSCKRRTVIRVRMRRPSRFAHSDFCLSAGSCEHLNWVERMAIAENLARVREQMQAAARRAGRQLEAIELMAVSKTFPAEQICEAHAAGARCF